mmetsp:Transcript_9505/g.15996  ORF Transcript_9505/g.15996 Transcript_9505/m.15996 type:complete len:101 (+) Transcript_9505:798-1100(+)
MHDKSYIELLPHDQRSIKYDLVFRQPIRSKFLKRVDGSIQQDKRVKLNNSMSDVSLKLERFQNLQYHRKNRISNPREQQLKAESSRVQSNAHLNSLVNEM